jgi:hypothetical protein
MMMRANSLGNFGQLAHHQVRSGVRPSNAKVRIMINFSGALQPGMPLMSLAFIIASHT